MNFISSVTAGNVLGGQLKSVDTKDDYDKFFLERMVVIVTIIVAIEAVVEFYLLQRFPRILRRSNNYRDDISNNGQYLVLASKIQLVRVFMGCILMS